MAAHRPFEELQARLAELFENSPAKDLERNLKALLASAFSRLELVTREEFDIQSKLLARTREKLVALEARVAALQAAAPHDPAAAGGGGSPPARPADDTSL